MKHIFLKTLASTACYSAFVYSATAQVLPIDYDDYSFFEEPNNFELPLGTLRTNATVDQTYIYDVQNSKDRHQTELLGRLNWEGQTESTAVIGAQYDGHYFHKGNRRYREQAQAYIRDDWGRLAIGNVSLGVRNDTRRRPGIGHAQLVADDFYGNLDQDAIYYRYGSRAYTTSMVVDREGRGEIGFNVARPLDESTYRFSWRARRGDTSDRDQFDGVPSANLIARDPASSYGTAVVGGYTYGSFSTDLQLGYERLNLKRSTLEKDRYFSSAGLYYKRGALSTSWEAMLGDYDGDTEFSSAVGFRLDVARGLSLQLVHNYTNYLAFEQSNVMFTTCYEF